MRQRNVTAALRNGMVAFAVGALARDRRTGLRAAVGVALGTVAARLVGRDPESVEFIEVVDEDGEPP